MKRELDRFINEIAKQIVTQPNNCTAEPYFVVQERVTVTGIDFDYTDDVAWVDCEGEVYLPGSEDFGNAEMRYQETSKEPEDWTRTGYAFRWESREFFLTRAGAENYIATKSHRHSGPLRVYTESAHSNPEIRAVRAFLAQILRAKLVPTLPTEEPKR